MNTFYEKFQDLEKKVERMLGQKLSRQDSDTIFIDYLRATLGKDPLIGRHKNIGGRNE